MVFAIIPTGYRMPTSILRVIKRPRATRSRLFKGGAELRAADDGMAGYRTVC